MVEPLPTGPYSIIYADPPWSYRAWSGQKSRTADSHYSTMSRRDLLELPVDAIAARDAVLFLWTTAPTLPQGLELIEAWGFRYKTVAFTWVKRNRKSGGWAWGLGHYTRANAEFCLLGTRGHTLPRESHSVHSVIDAPRGRHSEKPSETRDRIVELFGDLPRIELFARQRADGWDAWGDEI